MRAGRSRHVGDGSVVAAAPQPAHARGTPDPNLGGVPRRRLDGGGRVVARGVRTVAACTPARLCHAQRTARLDHPSQRSAHRGWRGCRARRNGISLRSRSRASAHHDRPGAPAGTPDHAARGQHRAVCRWPRSFVGAVAAANEPGEHGDSRRRAGNARLGLELGREGHATAALRLARGRRRFLRYRGRGGTVRGITGALMAHSPVSTGQLHAGACRRAHRVSESRVIALFSLTRGWVSPRARISRGGGGRPSSRSRGRPGRRSDAAHTT